jgi:hypothetical protein
MPADTIGTCIGNAIPIDNIVVIIQNGRSFDHYYGHLPGNGQDDVDVPTVHRVVPSRRRLAQPVASRNRGCAELTNAGWNASHRNGTRLERRICSVQRVLRRPER